MYKKRKEKKRKKKRKIKVVFLEKKSTNSEKLLGRK